MSILKRAGLALALTAAVGSVATPALADACCEAAAPVKPAASWFAPFDDEPGQQVKLFGLVELPANLGTIDRSLRLGAGAGLIAAAAIDPLSLGTAGRIGTGAAAAVLTWTGLTGSCLAYMPFGLSTRKAAEEAEE